MKKNKVTRYLNYILPVFIVILIHIILFIKIYQNNPSYLFGTDKDGGYEHIRSNFLNPDAAHFYIMGKNLLEYGVFSRSVDDPRRFPDFHRTPIYPIFLALTRFFSSRLGMIYIMQSFLYVLSVLLVAKIALIITSTRVLSTISGLLVALNINFYAYSFISMAESLYIFFTLMVMWLFLTSIKTRSTTLVVLTSLTAGINILIWPGTKFISLFYSLLLFLFLNEKLKKRILLAIVFLIGIYVALSPWALRNYKLFGKWEISSTQPLQIIYCFGGGGYSLRYGLGCEEARDKIASDFGLPSYSAAHNFWKYDLAPNDIMKLYKDKQSDVLSDNLIYSLMGGILGVLKSHISHNIEIFAGQFGETWQNPGLRNIYHGDIDVFFSNLLKNDKILVILFIWQYFYLFVLYSVVAVGIAKLLLVLIRTRVLRDIFLPFFFISHWGYFILLIVVVNLFSYARHAMLVQLIYSFLALYGLMKVSEIKQMHSSFLANGDYEK